MATRVDAFRLKRPDQIEDLGARIKKIDARSACPGLQRADWSSQVRHEINLGYGARLRC